MNAKKETPVFTQAPLRLSDVCEYDRLSQASNDVEDDARSERSKATSSTIDCRLIRLQDEQLCLLFSTSWIMEWNFQLGPCVTTSFHQACIQGNRFNTKTLALLCVHSECLGYEQQWSQNIFTDKWKLRLFPTDERVRKKAPPNERNYSSCTIDTSYGGGSVHVWAVITASRESQLMILG